MTIPARVRKEFAAAVAKYTEVLEQVQAIASVDQEAINKIIEDVRKAHQPVTGAMTKKIEATNAAIDQLLQLKETAEPKTEKPAAKKTEDSADTLKWIDIYSARLKADLETLRGELDLTKPSQQKFYDDAKEIVEGALAHVERRNANEKSVSANKVVNYLSEAIDKLGKMMTLPQKVKDAQKEFKQVSQGMLDAVASFGVTVLKGPVGEWLQMFKDTGTLTDQLETDIAELAARFYIAVDELKALHTEVAGASMIEQEADGMLRSVKVTNDNVLDVLKAALDEINAKKERFLGINKRLDKEMANLIDQNTQQPKQTDGKESTQSSKATAAVRKSISMIIAMFRENPYYFPYYEEAIARFEAAEEQLKTSPADMEFDILNLADISLRAFRTKALDSLQTIKAVNAVGHAVYLLIARMMTHPQDWKQHHEMSYAFGPLPAFLLEEATVKENNIVDTMIVNSKLNPQRKIIVSEVRPGLPGSDKFEIYYHYFDSGLPVVKSKTYLSNAIELRSAGKDATNFLVSHRFLPEDLIYELAATQKELDKMSEQRKVPEYNQSAVSDQDKEKMLNSAVTEAEIFIGSIAQFKRVLDVDAFVAQAQPLLGDMKRIIGSTMSLDEKYKEVSLIVDHIKRLSDVSKPEAKGMFMQPPTEYERPIGRSMPFSSGFKGAHEHLREEQQKPFQPEQRWTRETILTQQLGAAPMKQEASNKEIVTQFITLGKTIESLLSDRFECSPANPGVFLSSTKGVMSGTADAVFSFSLRSAALRNACLEGREVELGSDTLHGNRGFWLKFFSNEQTPSVVQTRQVVAVNYYMFHEGDAAVADIWGYLTTNKFPASACRTM